MSHDVFICHGARDGEVAGTACDAIERAGHSCWIASRDAAPGEHEADLRVEAVGSGKVFLVILSADSAHSAQVRRETGRAASAGLAIVPFRIEEVEPPADLACYFGAAPRLDALQPPLGPHLDHLAAIVGRLLEGGAGAPMRPLTAPPGPIPPVRRPTPSWLPIALAGLIGLVAIAAVAWIMGAR